MEAVAITVRLVQITRECLQINKKPRPGLESRTCRDTNKAHLRRMTKEVGRTAVSMGCGSQISRRGSENLCKMVAIG